jgi:ribosome hibernation promoting factor
VNVRVHGSNMQVREHVREIAEEKVQHAGRIFDTGGSTDVEFTRENNPRRVNDKFKVEITTHQAGHTVRVESSAPDDVAALDIALEKFERQLRRLKERLYQRSRNAEKKHLNTADQGPDDDHDSGPVVVRTKRFEMRPMMVDEAVLQMEMLGHAFFFFLDADTGKHCVLYHRRDGSLGLIEPT